MSSKHFGSTGNSKASGGWICLTGGEFWASGGGWHQDCLLLLLLLLLEPLPGVHHLMTQDDTSLFLVLLVELQIEIQYNTIIN